MYCIIFRSGRKMAYYIGVDVGTGSVRAALVSEKGCMTESAVEPIHTGNPQPGYYEQSSSDIWRAVLVVVNVSSILYISFRKYLTCLKVFICPIALQGIMVIECQCFKHNTVLKL